MDSCSWMKRPYQNVGPPSQAAGTSQLINGTIGKQQACVSQRTYFTHQDGGYSNRQTSYWQTSQSPHQALSSQQPAGGETSKYLKASNGNQQNLLINSQSGNTLVTHVATQQNFRSNSRLICSWNQSPPNKRTENSVYPQQSMSAPQKTHTVNWKRSPRPPNGKAPPEYFRHLHRLLTNGDGGSVESNVAYTVTATSLPQGQVGCTNTVVSVPASNRQTVHHGISCSTPPPNYHMACSQLLNNESVTTNSSSNGHFPSMFQTTPENPHHLNPTHTNMEETTCRSLYKANEHFSNPGGHTQGDMLKNETIARIVEDLQTSFVHKSDQNMRPVPLTITASYNSNVSQSVPHNSRQSLPHTTPSVMSSPQQNSKPNVPYMTTSGDGYGWAGLSNENGTRAANLFTLGNNGASNGNLVGPLSNASKVINQPENITSQRNQSGSSAVNNHEILERIPSSPGRTGTRAVAVVQPLSQEGYQGISKYTSPSTTNKSAEQTAIYEPLSNLEKLAVSTAVEKKNEAPWLKDRSEFYTESPLSLIHI